MGGKPGIRRLRVTVRTILGLLASGHSRERILQAYPYLEGESRVRAVTKDLVDAAEFIHNKGLAVWVSSTKK